jgi:hypothetical protein
MSVVLGRRIIPALQKTFRSKTMDAISAARKFDFYLFVRAVLLILDGTTFARWYQPSRMQNFHSPVTTRHTYSLFHMQSSFRL